MVLDPRWKNPTSAAPQSLHLWAQDLVRELRKGLSVGTADVNWGDFGTATAGFHLQATGVGNDPVWAGFTQSGTGAVTRTWADKARELLTGVDFGAVGDDLTSNATAIANARTAAGANRPIELIRGDYNANVTTSMYPHSPQDALGRQWLLGTTSDPATRHEPILWVEKVTASTRDAPFTSAFDQGAAYLSLEKRSGTAFGVAATAYALYSGGEGDLVAFHGRTRISAAGSGSQRGYAGWFYTRVDSGVTPEAWHALELNGQNFGTDLGYLGDAQLLRLAMADGADVKASTAISIGLAGTTGDSGFWTGLHIEAESILTAGTAYSDDGEAIRIDGPASSSDRIGGLRFGSGEFKYALNAIDGTFLNTAPIILKDSDRVVWGAPATTTTWVRGETSAGLLTLRGGNGVVPSGNDNTPLGTASLQWSDLFAVDAVLSGGLRVGFTGAPTADRVEIGDANFCLDLSGLGDANTSTLLFDSGDSLRYDRTNNAFGWRIGASTRLTLTSSLLNMVGTMQMDALQIDQTPTAVSGGSVTIGSAATINTRIQVNMNGTTYWIPASTTAF